MWYCKWWIGLLIKFFRLLYRLGELILEAGVKLIDFHDMLWDELEENIRNIGEHNELD